jgi:hypothetical protein
MNLSLLFWLVYIICLVLGVWFDWPAAPGAFRPLGKTVVIFVLLFILRWAQFGAPVHQ